MNGYYINIHVKASDSDRTRQAVSELFAEHGFLSIGDESAQSVVDDEDKLPAGEDWYGVLVSGKTGKSWTAVYVEDWQDSGVLAKGLSALLETPALEVWVAEDTHWGYTYYESGTVKDRFANAPEKVAATPDEAKDLMGRADTLSTILSVPVPEFAQALRGAQEKPEEFVGTAIDALARAVGLPFEHILIGYESFFEDDADDYSAGLENWPQWRHLAYRHPQGKELLSE